MICTMYLHRRSAVYICGRREIVSCGPTSSGYSPGQGRIPRLFANRGFDSGTDRSCYIKSRALESPASFTLRNCMTRRLLSFSFFLAILFASLPAQTTSSVTPNPDEQLKYVVYLSRHGVRSPTGKPAQYNAYSAASWPDLDVPPGYLTAHGYHLMELFGAYDRVQLAGEGLVLPRGCGGADTVTLLRRLGPAHSRDWQGRASRGITRPLEHGIIAH